MFTTPACNRARVLNGLGSRRDELSLSITHSEKVEWRLSCGHQSSRGSSVSPVWQPLAPALWLSQFWFRHMTGSCVPDLESFTRSVLPRCTRNAVDCSGIITEKVSQTKCSALQYAIWGAPQLSRPWVSVLAFLQGNFWKMSFKPLNAGFEPTKLTSCIHMYTYIVPLRFSWSFYFSQGGKPPPAKEGFQRSPWKPRACTAY